MLDRGRESLGSEASPLQEAFGRGAASQESLGGTPIPLGEQGFFSPVWQSRLMLSNLGQEEDLRRAMDGGRRDTRVKANVSLQSLVRQVKETVARGGSGEAPAPGHPAV